MEKIKVGRGGLWIILGLYALIHYTLWMHYPPDVDPINFMTALSHYDVSVDSPHPPGYPGYVGLATLASHLVGISSAYQFVNLALVLATALSLYFALCRLGLPYQALSAMTIALIHPLLLSASVMPESYVSDACFGAILYAWLTIIASDKKPSDLNLFVGIFTLFFAFGLFRVVTDVLLLPLLMILLWQYQKDKALVIKGLITAGIAIVLAWISTVIIAGGYETYHTAVDRVMGNAVRESSVLAGASIGAHLKMGTKLVAWLVICITPFVLLTGYLRVSSKQAPESSQSRAITRNILIAWVLPALSFYALVYYLKPLYLLIFLPVYAICTASALDTIRLTKGKLSWIVSLGLILAGQLAFFFAPQLGWSYPIYRHSYAYTRDQDALLSELKRTLDKLPQGNTLLVWGKVQDASIYTLRLFTIPKVAIINGNSLQFLDPHTMHWGSVLSLQEISGDHFDHIVELTQQGKHFKLVEIKHLEQQLTAE